MIRVTDNILIGSSHDESDAEVDAVLNVAKDLIPTRAWPEVDYYHIGLIDGPGNPILLYTSAILTLASLKERRTLVCCHSGRSRSVSIVTMYLHLIGWFGWDGSCTIMSDQFSGKHSLGERVEMLERKLDKSIPTPNDAHGEAFNIINWRPLFKLIEG